MSAILKHIEHTNTLVLAKLAADKVVIITRNSKNPGVDVK